jgi:MSHA biogenesis protein MshM
VRVVTFIEEAQGMPIETLEEIRLLSNLETQDEKLLQIVMFGQPELDETLATPRIRQLKERITYSFYLPPFTAHEVAEYLTTRLRACGYQGMGLFTHAAVRSLTRSSRGLLRRINLLADKALLAAYAANAVKVTAGHVRLASRDSEFGSGPRRAGRVITIAACIVLALGGALWWAGGVLLGEGRGASFTTQARIGDAPLVARASEGATTSDSLAGRSPSLAPAPVPGPAGLGRAGPGACEPFRRGAQGGRGRERRVADKINLKENRR